MADQTTASAFVFVVSSLIGHRNSGNVVLIIGSVSEEEEEEKD